jgi:hypothetical protein
MERPASPGCGQEVRMTRRVLALAACVLLGSACFFSHGHFDPFDHGDDFQAARMRFTQYVRWGEFERAAALVAPDARADFLESAATLGQVRFTDYEVVDEQIADGFETATVQVVYRAYRLDTMIERSVLIEQEWSRSDDGWQVRPRFAEVSAALRGGTP